MNTLNKFWPRSGPPGSLWAVIALWGVTLLIFYKYVFMGLSLNPAYELLQFTEREPAKPHYLIIHDESPQRLHTPNLIFNKWSFKQGKLPLWNPYNAAGTPHLGSFQSAPFSPLRIFYYLCPFRDDYSFFIFMKVWLLGVSAFFLARVLHISGSGALFAAVIFMGGGYTMSSLYFLDGETMLLLPLILILVEKLSASVHRLRLCLMLGVLEGLLLLSGHPEIIFVGVLGVSAYAATRFFVPDDGLEEQRGGSRLLLWHLGALALGLLISAFMLREFWLCLQTGLTYKTDPLHGHNLSLISIFEALTFLGNLFFPDVVGLKLLNYINLYIGILPLGFCWAAMVVRPRRLWPLFAMLLLSLLLFLGVPGLTELPLIKGLSRRHLFPLMALALSLMSGYGWDIWVRKRKERFIYAVGAIYLVAFIILALLIDNRTIQTWSFNWRLAVPLGSYGLPLLAGLLLYGLRKRPVAYAAGCVIGAAALGYIVNAQDYFYYNKYCDTEHARTLPAFKSEPTPIRTAAVAPGISPAQTNLLLGLESCELLAPIVSKRYAAYWSLVEKAGRESDINGNNAENVWRNLIAQSNIAYFLSWEFKITRDAVASEQEWYLYKDWVRPNFSSGKLLPLSRQGLPPQGYESDIYSGYRAFKLYRNPYVFPRAFLVDRIVPVPTERKFTRAIEEMIHPSRDLRSEAVVEYSDAEAARTLTTLNRESLPLKSETRITRYEYDRVILTVKSNRRALLVLNDAYYPGWQALIDGRESRIYPTDLMFRGVIIPPGEHQVEFRYRPQATLVLFGAAVITLAASLLTIGGLFIRERCKKIKERSV